MKIELAIATLFSFRLLVSAADVHNPTNAPSVTRSPSSTSEQRLLAIIPELEWSQERFVAEGWMKPDQVLQPKANNFSKKNVMRFGVPGDVNFLFDDKRLLDCSFYISDGEVGTHIGDDDWTKLYNSIKTICNVPEIRTGDASSSSIYWKISAAAKEYDVRLTRRVFGTTIERGVEISIKPVKK